METACAYMKSHANGSRFSLLFNGRWRNGNLLSVSDKYSLQGHIGLRKGYYKISFQTSHSQSSTKHRPSISSIPGNPVLPTSGLECLLYTASQTSSWLLAMVTLISGTHSFLFPQSSLLTTPLCLQSALLY